MSLPGGDRVRLERPVGDGEGRSQAPGIRDVRLVVLGVALVVVPGQAALEQREAVHLPAVDGGHLGDSVVGGERHDIACVLERDDRPVIELPLCRSIAPARVGAELAEHVVERVVLLVQDHDVPDGRSRWGWGHQRLP